MSGSGCHCGLTGTSEQPCRPRDYYFGVYFSGSASQRCISAFGYIVHRLDSLTGCGAAPIMTSLRQVSRLTGTKCIVKPFESDLTLCQLRWLDAYDLMDDRARDDYLRVEEAAAVAHPGRVQSVSALWGGLPRVSDGLILQLSRAATGPGARHQE